MWAGIVTERVFEIPFRTEPADKSNGLHPSSEGPFCRNVYGIGTVSCQNAQLFILPSELEAISRCTQQSFARCEKFGQPVPRSGTQGLRMTRSGLRCELPWMARAAGLRSDIPRLCRSKGNGSGRQNQGSRNHGVLGYTREITQM